MRIPVFAKLFYVIVFIGGVFFSFYLLLKALEVFFVWSERDTLWFGLWTLFALVFPLVFLIVSTVDKKVAGLLLLSFSGVLPTILSPILGLDFLFTIFHYTGPSALLGVLLFVLSLIERKTV